MIINFIAIFVFGLAAVYDVVYRRVPNFLVLSAVIGILLYKFNLALSAGGDSLGSGLATAIFWYPAWSFRFIGGGDHKLLLLSAVVVGLQNVILINVSIVLIGGIISAVFVGARYISLKIKVPFKKLIKTTKVPYALAIFAGYILVAFSES